MFLSYRISLNVFYPLVNLLMILLLMSFSLMISFIFRIEKPRKSWQRAPVKMAFMFFEKEIMHLLCHTPTDGGIIGAWH
ncbi:hypothetical protein HanRHA438_Chr12g0560781 [Helianthus annuus]|nr:hypothetical protein HanRHA438_Chr12g0560781 [Helianthus annuus]